jgi:hypothetical protein
VSNALVEYFGLYPTLAELAGLPKPEKIDATSLVPWLKNPDAKGPEAAFAEYALSWEPRVALVVIELVPIGPDQYCWLRSAGGFCSRRRTAQLFWAR